ncbi:flavin-containing monooxygenase [Nakamurella alba]|uniref:flavin-containing monooxygenase n=1 Tax=Nakamurella alba TaxID=2665158 RepID=UPI002AC35020|nr:NAD(P)-binding domain-containing protein [Nakamurella alba]
MSTPRYCIIGAGAAGLAALRVLGAHGIDVDCFERSDRVGGHWHTDYESLHLITSRDLSGFAGDPMPPDYPVYPSRAQMVDYIESFADRHGLREKVTFGTTVTEVRPRGERGSDGWTVTTDDGTVRDYDAVLIANGHLTDPRIPAFAGEFTGHQVHSADYHDASDIQGTRVLVVGAGNSGCDLAVDAAHARLDAHVSVRSGQVFQPKALLGRPRAELRWPSWLPDTARERITRAMVRIAVGAPTSYRGLQAPLTENLNKQRPVVNSLLPYWIQHGRITARPGIERFAGRTVHFTDGSSGEFDTVLWATGFHTSLPFLDRGLLTWRDGVPLRVAGLTVPVGTENLYLIGLAAPRGPQLPVYSAQAELVARFLQHGRPVSAALAAQQTPDSRIDIIRKEWQQQMDHTHRYLDRLPAAPAPTRQQVAAR